MFQNSLLQQYENKTKNIDQIAQWTMVCKQKKISQKYANIYSTVRLLKNLINDFTKKSHKVQQQFKQTAKIENLTKQTEFHQKRILECQALSKYLSSLIQQKKQRLENYQMQAKTLREQLVLAKTQNIKKIIKIQFIQNEERQNKQKQKKLLAKKVMNLKMQQNRNMLKTVFSFQQTRINQLNRQKEEATQMLWQKIHKKINLQKILKQSYINMKQKLIQQQKKSNIYGLTGSLLFKLLKNQDTDKSTVKPYLKLKHSDSKLMIYDVLKRKHSNETKNMQQIKNLLSIPLQKFLLFTNIQILGLIQLKGGLKQCKNDKQKENQMPKYIKKQCKKQNRYITYTKST